MAYINIVNCSFFLVIAGCFGGCCTPLLCMYTPLSVFQRLMVYKADLYSIIITKQLHTCKYTAIDCAIVTSQRIGGGFETSALDSTPCTPLFQNSGENTDCRDVSHIIRHSNSKVKLNYGYLFNTKSHPNLNNY